MCLVKFVSSVERAMLSGRINGRIWSNRRKCQVAVLMLKTLHRSHICGVYQFLFPSLVNWPLWILFTFFIASLRQIE
jgi:hypothetical protein